MEKVIYKDKECWKCKTMTMVWHEELDQYRCPCGQGEFANPEDEEIVEVKE